MNINTLLAHCGLLFDRHTGAVSTPIYQTATFCHPGLDQSTGYDYSRTGNPTRQVIEESIAVLEGGCRGFAFASGMAALTTVLLLFKSGDHLLVSEDLYGGTYRLLEKVLQQFGLRASYIDTTNLAEIESNLADRTRGILIESPTNPLMKITDLAGAAALAHQHDLLTIVDNTFMTPYFQRPLELGADIVVHSASKYLGGHNDLLAGLVVAREDIWAERIFFVQNSVGAVLAPHDAWLLTRSLKTLGLRLERHQSNALHIAKWLSNHPQVAKVYYPGLPEHPGHDLLQQQASGFGGMISFEVNDPALVPQVLERVRVISFAESLGGVESLITFPAKQTHADIPAEIRLRIGVTDRLLRLSIGIEDAGDLIADLEQALA